MCSKNFPQIFIILSTVLGVSLSSYSTGKCEGNGLKLKYLWGDAMTDNADCIGPMNKPYPMAAVARSFRNSNPWMGNSRTGRSSPQKTIDPNLMRQVLLDNYENINAETEVETIRKGRAAAMNSKCPTNNPSQRLCKTRYNTTAPMYGVSLTSGQPVTIVQKFPDLLQQVVFEVCESSECSVLRGECTQTYVPYLFLVIPLGPVTLTGQDYVLVESGCVCRPKDTLSYSDTSSADAIAAVVPQG
ncbi:uncharacterized protein LOC123305718 [Chrysoperla carnea]|uniref:uncharacterized protein LOC123305718 n=1 Tax=Chrysoperla carnea TaxID=189513 RepID=UPI001D0998C5|nr:uncharacterized protein LOC123305718 [Chrysoperla carnea]